MKKLLFTISSILLLSSFISFSQQATCTVDVKPDGARGKDANVNSFTNGTSGTYSGFDIMAWTNSGTFQLLRGLIDFEDLAQIPQGASVINATLYLYWNNISVNPGHSTLSGSNNFVIQRIIEPWDENTVIWANQPSSTTQNQISVQGTPSESQDYVIDITTLVQDYVNNPSSSYGFLFKLATEQQYRSLIFASSDHSNAALHPRLVVDYNCTLSTENKMLDGFDIYPNPTSDFITIVAPYSYDITVYDITGKQVLTSSIHTEGSNKIDVRSLENGAYVLNLKTSDGQEINKKVTIRQ